MRRPEKITKSEIWLLAVTAAFVALALAIHFSPGTERAKGGYDVRTWRAEESVGQIAPIDINTADEEELCQLPGIGPALAGRIVADRTANGPYATLDDLMRVSGIGEKTLTELRPYVTVGTQGEEVAHENTGG